MKGNDYLWCLLNFSSSKTHVHFIVSQLKSNDWFWYYRIHLILIRTNTFYTPDIFWNFLMQYFCCWLFPSWSWRKLKGQYVRCMIEVWVCFTKKLMKWSPVSNERTFNNITSNQSISIEMLWTIHSFSSFMH